MRSAAFTTVLFAGSRELLRFLSRPLTCALLLYAGAGFFSLSSFADQTSASRSDFSTCQSLLESGQTVGTEIETAEFWTKSKIIEVFEHLDAKGYVLKSTVLKDKNSPIHQEIKTFTKRKNATGFTLLWAAQDRFGTLRNTIANTSIKKNVARTVSKQIVIKNLDAVPAAIRALHEAGFDVSASSMRFQLVENEQAKEILFAVLNEEAHTRSLYYAGKRKSGSWDKALIEAELAPSDIRQDTFHAIQARNRKKYISSEGVFAGRYAATQYSADGSKESIGAIEETPESMRIEKENQTALKQYFRSLSDRQQKITSLLMEVLAEEEGLDLPQVMTLIVDRQLVDGVTIAEIQAVVTVIREQKELLQLLMKN